MRKEAENKMKLNQVILNFVMFLAITLIGTGAMGCNVKAASARSVYSALKKEPGLKNAKQWMVVKEDKHNYVVLASQVNAEQFKKDKVKVIKHISGSDSNGTIPISADYNMYHVKGKDGSIRVKAINVDPQDENPWLLNDAYIEAANSVQIYNSLKEVAKVIE